MEKLVAIYIDFENIVISAEEAYGRCDLSKVFSVSERYGRTIIKCAYGDWTRFSRYRQELLEHAVDLTQLFRYGAHTKKNSADIVMAVDAMDCAFHRDNVDIFILVTGDSDFSAVARKIRSYGKQVIGIGLRDATSEILVRSCDEFILYDSLVEGDEGSSPYAQEQARDLLVATLQKLTDDGTNRLLPANEVFDSIQSKAPEFDLIAMGYRDFRHFLLANQDLVSVYATPEGHSVALRSTIAARAEIDETLQYRTALNTAGIRLIHPPTRDEILGELYHLLHDEPDTYTYEEAILHLKERYDTSNRLRSREEIQSVAWLMKHAGVLEPHPQSWDLDTLSLDPELSEQGFTLRCESVYLSTLMQKNLDIQDDLVARLIFGSAADSHRIEALKELASQNSGDSISTTETVNGFSWPRFLVETPEIEIVLKDLANWQLEEEPSLAAASQLNEQGLRVRTSDFEQARVYFLQAAKMMYVLLRDKVPGASIMDLEWYLASYAAATAGAFFSRYNYSQAVLYYLAFFAMVKETEPVWDKVRKLVPPMLSFYFTIAPSEFSDLLKVSPGRTHPARLSVILHNHPNPQVRTRWLQLVQELVKINPPLLRSIIQRLAFLEEEDQLEGAFATRRTLSRLINNEDVPADPAEVDESPVEDELLSV